MECGPQGRTPDWLKEHACKTKQASSTDPPRPGARLLRRLEVGCGCSPSAAPNARPSRHPGQCRAPGWIETNMTVVNRAFPSAAKAVIISIPLGRMAKAVEVASACPRRSHVGRPNRGLV